MDAGKYSRGMIMQKAIFIYNPLSGDRSIPQRLDSIIKQFQEKNILVQPFSVTTDCQDILVELLKNGGYSFAVISGGDGTINHFVNMMLKNNITLPFGIVPSGTSNDFARCVNLPGTLMECIDVILAGNTIDVDAGLINDSQYFLSTCAGGVFVDVSFNTHNELKRNFGPFAYYLKALSELASIKSFKVKLETEKETIEEEILLFLILNGKHAAGFYNLIEDADLSDGIMDIIMIKSCSHIDLATLFFNVLTNAHLNNKNVIKLSAKTCNITCEGKSSCSIDLSVDGEKGDKLPINVKFINKALKVFVK